jgi:hypothetical protein
MSNFQTLILSSFLALVGAGLTKMGIDIPGLIMVGIGCVGGVSVIIFNVYRSKTPIFPSNLIPWLVLRFRKNNPNVFPHLNETALKKHIALVASHCPFEVSIKNIYLFEGTPFKYQLVVIGRNTKNIQDLQTYWEKEAPDLFKEDFIEIYRQTPNIVFRYQKGSFWSDWNVLVIESLKDVPHDLALRKYKWVLY